MDDDEKAELISRLFALLTSRFEDGAQIALERQGTGHDTDDLRSSANRIWGISEEILTIAMATSALLPQENAPEG